MKTIVKKLGGLVLSASILLMGTVAYAQTEVSVCNDRADVVVNQLDVQGNEVIAKYDITFIPNVVNSCCCEAEAIVVTPAIINEKTGDKVILEVIVVNDTHTTGMNAWLEERCKACSDNVRVFTITENKPLTVSSDYAVNYEEWMDDAYLMITTQKMKYPECLTRLCGPEKICPINNEPEPQWAAINAKPKDPSRAVKTRLYFPVNVIKSVDTYFENADALALLATLNSPNFDVFNIKIEGWASPEASVAYNQKLSDNRAKTMKKIIAEKYDFDDNVYAVSGNGEYWDDVINYINTSDNATILASKDKLVKFVNDTEGMNLDKKEAELKKIDGGKPYNVIFKEVYPRSRFTDCMVQYKLKEFDKAAVKDLYRQAPDQLSEADYVALAGNGDNVDKAILADGLKYYPESEPMNAVAGDLAVKDGNIDAALSYYQKAGDSKEAYNNQACCWILKGNKDEAKACLDKAKGIDQYDPNCKELSKLR